MKNTAWYNKLWQTKMEELPVKGDTNAAWQKMQGLLDTNLPVNGPAAGIKKPGNSLGGGIATVVAIIITGAILYYAGSRIFGAHQPKTNKQNVTNIKSINKDKTDSAATKSTATNRLSNNTPGSLPVAKAAASGSTAANNKSGTSASAIVKANSNSKAQTALANSKLNNKAHVTAYNNITVNAANRSGSNKSKNNGAYITHTHQQTAALVQHAHRLHNADNRLQAGDNNHAIVPYYQAHLDSVKAGLINYNKNSPGAKRVTVVPDVRKKPDSSLINAANAAKKATADKAAQSKASADAKAKNKLKPAKKENNSNFELGVKLGVNTGGSFTPSTENKNFYGKSSVDAFLGISGTYYFSPSFGIGISAHILSPKVVSVTYLNTAFVTLSDSGRQTIHPAGRLSITSSRKMYTLDVPLNLVYRFSNNISFNAGPVISLPIKQDLVKSSLNRVTVPLDTINSTDFLNTGIKSTTIDNTLKFSFAVGAKVYFKRFYFDAGYMQTITPYKLTSTLGNTNIYYHNIQFGVGYLLFKPKPKP